jgi:hypothetical protein
VGRWLRLNWGPDADLRDHNHPWHPAALRDGSPVARLTEAQCALDTACFRFRMSTGRDGLALAREIIASGYGQGVAERALAPLVQRAMDWGCLDDVLSADGPAPLPPTPEPTPAQRQAAAAAYLDHRLSYPDMGDLQACLAALAAAWQAHESGEAAAVRSAVDATGTCVGTILERAGEGERANMVELIQAVLNAWKTASGVPVQMNVVVRNDGGGI